MNHPEDLGAKGFALLALLVSLVAAQGGWVVQSSGTTANLNAVRFRDANTGWVAGDGGVILKTTNGGEAWSPRSTGTTQALRALHFASPLIGWAVGDGGVILRTLDGGETWDLRPSPVSSQLRTVRFVGDSGWIGGDSGVLLRTVDGGASWTRLAPEVFTGGYARINALAFVAGGIGYAATGDDVPVGNAYQGTLLRTTNGGVLWSDMSSGYRWGELALIGDTLIALRTRWITFGPGRPSGSATEVMLTTNQGGSWILLSQGHSVPSPISIHFLNSQMGWAAGTGGAILRWTDPDGWFTQRSGNMSERLNSVYFVNAETGLAVGANGTILRTHTGGVTVRPVRDASAGAPLLHGNRFTYRLSAPQQVRIWLSRMDGTVAAVMVDGLVPAGAHTLRLSGRVPAGLYVLGYRSGSVQRRFRALVP